jgi:type I restriction enzyme R subunit
MEDYNKRYEQDFSLKIFSKFKKDIASRLAHKKPYNNIEKNPEKQIDLLIVVDQMLTGFDSKWINTLYLDKVLKYETIIQAFSRTNRLFGADKPFGTIRYYRYPHTMEENINKAVKLYSGDKPLGLFADRLENNLAKLNRLYDEISELFENAKIENFEKLPDDLSERAEFAKLFKKFNETLEASKIQGFKWSELEYKFEEPKPKRVVKLDIDENTYLILVQRYKELPSSSGSGGNIDIPFEIEGYITEIDTDKIDTDFMNSRFDKYRKIIDSGDTVEIEKTLNELHKSFATLSQEEQKYANIFIHDIQNGDIQIDSSKTFREYVSQYQANAENSQIIKLVERFGLDNKKLKEIMSLNVSEININEYGRFDELKNSVDKEKAKAYFEEVEGCKLSIPKVNIKVHNLLKDFILSGGYDSEDNK